jgi:hypothetical protein
VADPYRNNVVLALPMEGERHGSTVILDRTGKTVTRNGDVILSTAVAPPFGTTSAYFDGTGDYLSIADSASFQFSTHFTIEAWVNFAVLPSASSGAVIMARQITGNRSWVLNFWNSAGQYQLNLVTSTNGSSTTGSAVGNVSLSTGAWYHVAGVRRNSQLMTFLNGVLVGAGTESGDLYVGSVEINVGRNADAAYYLNGYLKDLRVTKGTARYHGNFYVDQKPFDWDNPEPVRIML